MRVDPATLERGRRPAIFVELKPRRNGCVT
jgi:hypothetical protein